MARSEKRPAFENLIDWAERSCTQRVGPLTPIPSLLRQFGADPDAVLLAAGLAPDALDYAENTVPYASLGRLLDESAKQSGCAHFGLLVGQAWNLSVAGAVGRLARHSATVGDALRSLALHHHLNSQGGLLFLTDHRYTVDLGYAVLFQEVVGLAQVYDCVVSICMSCLRELCGPRWNPSEAFLARVRPLDVDPYRRFFRTQLHFDAEVSMLQFPSSWLNLPVAGADAEQRRIAEKEVEAADPMDLVSTLWRSLRLLLLKGVSSGDAIAKHLAMHRRTLNRRLKALGTSFQDVLDQVRFEIARQLLDATHLPLDDVAAALGYASLSPFERAFRRWSGTTPGRWRGNAQRVNSSEYSRFGD